MLSYMLPPQADDKSAASSRNNLSLDFAGALQLNNGNNGTTIATSTDVDNFKPNGRHHHHHRQQQPQQPQINGNGTADSSAALSNGNHIMTTSTAILAHPAGASGARLLASDTVGRPPLPPSATATMPPSALRLSSSTATPNGILVSQSPQQPSANGTTTSNMHNPAADAKCSSNRAGTKSVALKRVSFGSSKGSMVETLVFETPTPLPEHAEREFAFGIGPNGAAHQHHQQQSSTPSSLLDDSGIEMAEELERSKVRVTFFQSGKAQQISPPDPFGEFHSADPADPDSCTAWKQFDPLDPAFVDRLAAEDADDAEDQRQHSRLSTHSSSMTATASNAPIPSYDRQMSTESGWDNPFRPGGDLSREADEIVNMIKGGKPITPTAENGNASFANGNGTANGTAEHNGEAHANGTNGTTTVDGAATKTNAAQQQQSTPQNGSSKATGDAKNGDPVANGQTQIQSSRVVMPAQQSATHVIVDDKKKKKCACCVLQ